MLVNLTAIKMKVFVLALIVALIGLSSAVILRQFLQSEDSVIDGSYIVKMKDGVNMLSFINNTSMRNCNGELVPMSDHVKFIYESFNGFSMEANEEQMQIFDNMQEIDFIEPDQTVKTTRTFSCEKQQNSEWGLARMSSTNALSGSPYNYYYIKSSGSDDPPCATVYVIDTGIYTAQSEFGGRATFGYSAISEESNDDLNVHGTHVSGIIGGNTYGIAKCCNLVAVKVLNQNGSGSVSGVMAGIDWVTKTAPKTGCVINMSLGGPASVALSMSVTNAVNAGIFTVVTAGNSKADACLSSPSGAPAVMTVAACDITDSSASCTNYGSCVDVHAPGVYIKSAWIGNTTATNILSGTSQASPHCAGLAAYFIHQYNLSNTTAIADRFKKYAIKDAIYFAPSATPNLLCNNGDSCVKT